MALTQKQIELNSALMAEYVLWYGKDFKKLPVNTQHQLLENLCEWGFGQEPLGCNSTYLQNPNKAFMEYTLTLSCDTFGIENFQSLLPKKIKQYLKAFEEEQNKKFINLFKSRQWVTL